MIDLYTLSVIIFFAVLGILIYKDRKSIDFKYVLIMRRTKRFRNLLDKIARTSPLFWKITGTIAIIVCLGSMIFGIYNLLNNAYLVYIGVIVPPPALAIPIPAGQTIIVPGFIGIPFWFWIIVVATILIPHETFHGIIARTEKIKLKDVGLMLLLLQFISIPVVIIYFIYTKSFDLILFLTAALFSLVGAFVEPEEKQLKKSKLITKLRVFSAGSFINIIIGISLALFVQTFIWSPNVHGILITSVNETSPASQIGLEPGMVIESIDNKQLSMNFYDYSFLTLLTSRSNSEDITKYISAIILSQTLSDYKPGDNVKLRVDGINYDFKLGEREIEVNETYFEKVPYIGITSEANTKDINLFFVVFPLLSMMSLLNILVGIFNILPLYPLDGGLVVKAITERYAKKISDKITLGLTFFMIFILIYLVIGPFIKI